jgi:hypothetical protein
MEQIGFIESIKQTQPALWDSIVSNAKTGLIVIDEKNDAITATNRLLLTYPDLHLAISSLINSWNEQTLKQTSQTNFKELIKDLKQED